jgi:hypothetical protein
MLAPAVIKGGERRSAVPVLAQLALVENLADEIEVLVLFVLGVGACCGRGRSGRFIL